MNRPIAHSAEVPIRLEGVGKEYRLYDSPRARLKALLTGRALHQSHWALQGVSLALRRGQCLGVVGHNGAGKSTLLKLITGTLQPSTGTLLRSGRVTAILELGAGFHPDFTGRENLYFGGSLIGIGREEMAALEPQVLAFAEIGEAIDRPVKTYSSGMTVRLAFALVTAVQPDLLIIDEALAVGDQHFQKKCVERIMAFKANGCTILFCSHSFYHIRRLCDTALWIDAGRVQMQAETEAVVAAYEVHTRLRENPLPELAEAALAAHQASTAAAAVGRRAGARIVSLVVDGLDGDVPPRLLGSDLRVVVTAQVDADETPHMLIMLEQYQGTGITSEATNADGVYPVRLPSGDWQAVLTFPDLPLHSGEYVVSAYLFDSAGVVVYDEWYQYLHFRFVNPRLTPGLVRLPHFWG